MKQTICALIVLVIGSSQNVIAQTKPCQYLNACKDSWIKAQRSTNKATLTECIEACNVVLEKCLNEKETILTAGAHRLHCKNNLKKLEESKINIKNESKRPKPG